MSKEKMLKKQTLAYLAKNNWGNAIGGFFITLIPFLLIVFIESTIASFVNIFFNEDKINLLVVLLLFFSEMLTVFGFLLLTPVFTGFQKMCYNISKGHNAELKDVFYYFKKGLYGKCLGMNINILGRVVGYFIVFSLPVIPLYVSSHTMPFMAGIIIAYLVIIMVCTFFISMKYTVAPCILFENENLSSSQIVKIGVSLAKSHLGTINMLTLSFFPYYLLCFFVVPWIFVAPYVNVAYMTNGKWITQLYSKKEN